MGETVPAIQFDNIAGCTGAQVVMNVHGSWPNHALALGMDRDAPLRDQFFEFARRFQQYPGELERVGSAPWQEVVVVDPDRTAQAPANRKIGELLIILRVEAVAYRAEDEDL
jgi:UbiD family decarboxylase